MGHYFWIYSERISWIFDYKVLRIPFHKKFPHFTKNCGNCKAPINKWIDINYDKFSETAEGKEKEFDYSFNNAYRRLN